MFRTSRSFTSLLVGLAVAAFSASTAYVTDVAVRAWRTCTMVLDFVLDLPAYAVTRVLSMFGPQGVFAMALERLQGYVKAIAKAWADKRDSGHYRAPGSWVSCAST